MAVFFCSTFFCTTFFFAFGDVYCSLAVTCWEKADFLALLCVMFFVLCHFPIRCPGSGVVLDCIDS